MCLEGIYGSFHNFLGRFHPHPLSAAPDSSLYYTQQKSLAVRTTINHTILLTKILNYELNHNLIPKPYQTRRFILLREHKKMYNILYKICAVFKGPPKLNQSIYFGGKISIVIQKYLAMYPKSCLSPHCMV